MKTIGIIGLSMAMVCLAGNVAASEKVDHSQMDHSQMDHSQHNADEHAQHRAMMNQEGYTRKQVSYQLHHDMPRIEREFLPAAEQIWITDR